MATTPPADFPFITFILGRPEREVLSTMPTREDCDREIERVVEESRKIAQSAGRSSYLVSYGYGAATQRVHPHVLEQIEARTGTFPVRRFSTAQPFMLDNAQAISVFQLSGSPEAGQSVFLAAAILGPEERRLATQTMVGSSSRFVQRLTGCVEAVAPNPGDMGVLVLYDRADHTRFAINDVIFLVEQNLGQRGFGAAIRAETYLTAARLHGFAPWHRRGFADAVGCSHVLLSVFSPCCHSFQRIAVGSTLQQQSTAKTPSRHLREAFLV